MAEMYFYGRSISTKFVVKNIASGNKTIRIFNYPILNGQTRDLLAIPGVSESDIRYSLLRGDLYIKLQYKEAIIVDTDIDLLQFNDEQKRFLIEHGANHGLEITAASIGALSIEQHKTLHQLIHFADGLDGPMEGFSGAYRETLPLGSPFPTQIIWWESNTKMKKIIEKTIIRNANQNPVVITCKVYDTDGITLLATLTDIITYSGPFETTRTRTVQ